MELVMPPFGTCNLSRGGRISTSIGFTLANCNVFQISEWYYMSMIYCSGHVIEGVHACIMMYAALAS